MQSPVRERDSSWERPFWGGEGTEGGATGDEDGFRFVPLRLLDPTECFWNAFLRLGNLAIVNCVSVVTTHPLSVDLVRRAAEDLARRHQALRLVIRLADASRVQRLQRSQREQVLAAAESLKGPACLGLDQAWPLLHFPPALTNSAASSTWSRRHSPLVENFFSLPSLGNNPRLSEAGTCCSALRAGLPQTYHPLGGTQSSPEEGPRRVSSSLKRDAAPPSAAQLCSCRRRRQFKFAFQERLGDVKVDVREATAPHWISSSGFPWPPDEAEGEDGRAERAKGKPSFGLLEEQPWMKAMAWEQRFPLDCENGGRKRAALHSRRGIAGVFFHSSVLLLQRRLHGAFVGAFLQGRSGDCECCRLSRRERQSPSLAVCQTRALPRESLSELKLLPSTKGSRRRAKSTVKAAGALNTELTLWPSFTTALWTASAESTSGKSS